MRVQTLVNALGVGASPFDCWLVLRVIKTLIPRMKMHEENAAAVSKFLSQHKNVKKVFIVRDCTVTSGARYYETSAERLGGMVSFEIKGGIEGSKCRHPVNKNIATWQNRLAVLSH